MMAAIFNLKLIRCREDSITTFGKLLLACDGICFSDSALSKHGRVTHVGKRALKHLEKFKSL